MELFDNLASHGLTVGILQVLIVVGVTFVIVGLYWRLIVAGAGIAFCVAVFAMPSTGTTITEKVNAADMAPAEFIEDCIHYNTNATKKSCQDSWKEQGNGIE